MQTFLHTPNSISTVLHWPTLHNSRRGFGLRPRVLTPVGWFAVSMMLSVLIGATLFFAI
ncbi:MAG: hypothetical protein ACP5QR_09410 [Rhizomicrobium sp.]